MAKINPNPELDTEEGAAPRVSRRQRRIEEQRQKIDALRKAERRRRMTWVGGIVLALAAIVAVVALLYQPPAQSQGRQVPIEGQDHVAVGTPIQYRGRPPSSGTHYGQTSGYGVFEREIEPGFWVHTLEHGGIVVLYRPDLCDAACVAQLRDVYNSAPTSQHFPGVRKMAVIPYWDMDHKIAAVAWGWVDEMDEVDKARLLAFYNRHVDRGPERAQ